MKWDDGSKENMKSYLIARENITSKLPNILLFFLGFALMTFNSNLQETSSSWASSFWHINSRTGCLYIGSCQWLCQWGPWTRARQTGNQRGIVSTWAKLRGGEWNSPASHFLYSDPASTNAKGLTLGVPRLPIAAQLPAGIARDQGISALLFQLIAEW